MLGVDSEQLLLVTTVQLSPLSNYLITLDPKAEGS